MSGSPRREVGLNLEGLGWTPALETAFAPLRAQGLEPGRIAVEDKHYFVVLTPQGDLSGQVTGKLLHETRSPSELPKVGDWVGYTRVPNEPKALIHQVLPRRTKLSRKVAGREIEEQVLVTNVDSAFVVQALDQSFKAGLLHRLYVMVLESGARPFIVLNKADLCPDVTARLAAVRAAAPDAPVVVVSAKTGQGLDQLTAQIRPGETIVFIGSSGVGKSTLINDLYGEEVQPTAEVRESDAKGRHMTTWRELIVLPNGALVIDTPGMREFQMWVAEEGFQSAFADVDALAVNCHFRDCGHTVEKRCAVLEAVASGQLPRERYERYLKLKAELTYLTQAQTKHSWIQRKRHGRENPRVSKRQRTG